MLQHYFLLDALVNKLFTLTETCIVLFEKIKKEHLESNNDCTIGNSLQRKKLAPGPGPSQRKNKALNFNCL